jgi:hypothetical protein
MNLGDIATRKLNDGGMVVPTARIRNRPGGFDGSILYWEMGFRRAVVEERPQTGIRLFQQPVSPRVE